MTCPRCGTDIEDPVLPCPHCQYIRRTIGTMQPESSQLMRPTRDYAKVVCNLILLFDGLLALGGLLLMSDIRGFIYTLQASLYQETHPLGDVSQAFMNYGMLLLWLVLALCGAAALRVAGAVGLMNAKRWSVFPLSAGYAIDLVGHSIFFVNQLAYAAKFRTLLTLGEQTATHMYFFLMGSTLLWLLFRAVPAIILGTSIRQRWAEYLY